ncbi:MAG: hypothetical protein EON48_19130, partial [Acetobacteraceae bacterium]
MIEARGSIIGSGRIDNGPGTDRSRNLRGDKEGIMSKRLIASTVILLASSCLAVAPAWAQSAPAGETDKQRIERLEAMVADMARRLKAQEDQGGVPIR